jgi:hypothetical protein
MLEVGEVQRAPAAVAQRRQPALSSSGRHTHETVEAARLRDPPARTALPCHGEHPQDVALQVARELVDLLEDAVR